VRVPFRPRPAARRVRPVDDDDSAVKARFSGGASPVLNVVKTIANNPAVFAPWSALARQLAIDGSLPHRERELVILRVGWRCQSVYEFGQHTRFGLQAGLSPEEIAAVTGDVPSGPWTGDERTLLTMVDELIDDDCVSDSTWERLVRRWTSAELVELVLLAGFYRMVSSALNTFGVEREDGVPGWPLPSGPSLK
jgi:4-carboxymuconolactone decarboxylase